MKDSRAWIEVNIENLENNIEQIRKKIKEPTKIMAVIKANAYGHGDILIAKKLNELGIEDFAIATLEEGIHLRENQINGSILILGYTPVSKLEKIIKYDLIQTLVDEKYAKQLQEQNQTGKLLKSQIKINTGMNRIGIRFNETEKLEEIYNCNKLEITGVFSHLAIADSKDESAVEFTKEQIKQLQDCIKFLKQKGYQTGKVHIQSSYGMLNYPECNFDYARMGIFIYGIQEEEREDFKLKPVLSLKSKIESIHKIIKEESVGYGRSYISGQAQTIAAVSIGYADGYPRALSNQDTNVILNGEYVPIVGRICMDQLMIKIPNEMKVEIGDTVTLIGKEGKKEITANELAQRSNTISYEIISRLGARLDRFVVEE